MPRDPLPFLAPGVRLLGRFVVDRELPPEPGTHVVTAYDVSNGGRAVVLRVPDAEALRRSGFDRALLTAARRLGDASRGLFDGPCARGLAGGIPVIAFPAPWAQTWASLFPAAPAGPLEPAAIRRSQPSAATPAEVVTPLAALARAVDDVHAAGWLHRDLRAGMIGFDPDGRVHLVAPVVAAARAAIGGETDAGRVQVHRAPETIVDGVFTAASDRFAVACLVLEALVGHPVARLGIDDPGRLARDARTLLPAPLGAVLATALDPAPDRRFPTCRAFAQAYAATVQALRAADYGPGDAKPGPAPGTVAPIGVPPSTAADSGGARGQERRGDGAVAPGAGSRRTVAVAVSIMAAIMLGVLGARRLGGREPPRTGDPLGPGRGGASAARHARGAQPPWPTGVAPRCAPREGPAWGRQVRVVHLCGSVRYAPPSRRHGAT
jgi:hypothetical protein